MEYIVFTFNHCMSFELTNAFILLIVFFNLEKNIKNNLPM